MLDTEGFAYPRPGLHHLPSWASVFSSEKREVKKKYPRWVFVTNPLMEKWAFKAPVSKCRSGSGAQVCVSWALIHPEDSGLHGHAYFLL